MDIFLLKVFPALPLDQFPELQTVGNTFVQACQELGIGILAAMICLIAFLIFTGFGNEHRQAYARAAALGLLLGFALLMFAPTIASVVKRMFPQVSSP